MLAEDSNIALRAQGGDLSALDELVEQHTERLFRVVGRMMNDRQESEEIVQEAWVRAWRGLPQFQADRPFFPWLARIAVNAARDSWRKRRPLDFADASGELEHLADQVEGPEPALERRELLAQLAQAVAQLRPEQRVVLSLRYEAGFSYQQIAATVDLPLNTVRTHLRRAKLALRQRLEVRDERLAG